MLAKIGAGFDAILLILPVHNFAHALDEESLAIFFEQRIPIAAPKNLDDVPSCAAKDRFEFLNDLAVSAHRPIQPLQIAVDDEDQIVELFAGSESYGPQRFRLIGFAIADESPNLAVRSFFQPAILEITTESRLVDGHDRTQSHRHRGKFPEIGHEPGMRIGGKAAARL